MIRQYTWRGWYLRHQNTVETSSAVLDSIVDNREHADHCIESLRIALMCHGDTTPCFNILDPDVPLGARGDISPQRKCRNFEQLQSWVIENRVNNPLTDDGRIITDQDERR